MICTINIRVILPFPPSVNHYWRSVNGRVLISAAGRAYRDDVQDIILDRGVQGFSAGERLAVTVLLCPPDKRRRDLDNSLKSLLDALQHAGLYGDDSQIDLLEIRRGPLLQGGAAEVTVAESTKEAT